MSVFRSAILCDSVNQTLLGKKITVRGWVNRRRDHGGLIFVDLRDRTGIIQLVFNPDVNKSIHEKAHSLRSEYVIMATGTLIERAAETVNHDLPTGKWELVVDELDILNSSETPPFMLDNAQQVDEELRLQYRYIDLRRERMQNLFKLRNNVTFAIREYFHNAGFYDIETPILTKNTPEGSREYLVPSRFYQGHVYALPQSPQSYKQLLMASGFEKYFQIARCFRDEDLRADRQPEFTQLDFEMSFVDEDMIQLTIEQMLVYVFEKVFNTQLSTPFPRLTYKEAFEKYGSDKPDTRFELFIHDATSIFHDTTLTFLRTILEKNGKIGALCLKNRNFTRSELDGWVDKAQKVGAKGLLWLRVAEDNKVESPVAKFLPDDIYDRLVHIFGSLSVGDVLFTVAGAYKSTWEILGRLRCAMAKEYGLIPDGLFNFLWVVDFPLLEWNADEKRWDALHHPFTSPEHDTDLFDKDPADITARAYDIILNGVELGGGSIRICKTDVQAKMFELIGLSPEAAQSKFGFLLEAQKFGFPPHGGAALGLDRFIMLLANTASIRDVIAFPKTQSGFDPLMQSPVATTNDVLQDYGMRLLPKKN